MASPRKYKKKNDDGWVTLEASATSKQLELLDTFGIKYKKNLSLYEATELISKNIKKVTRTSWQPFGIGNGGTLYEYGRAVYVDDGNGREWFEDDDYEQWD